MQYSNIRSRAGLVALVVALIISIVSAVPIPATEYGLSSTLSNPNLNGHDHIELDATKISLSARMLTPPIATRALTRRHISTDMDDQLVRRSIGSKIKHAFQKVGHAFKKAGNAIKHVAQKVGNGIKKVAKKVGNGIKKAAKKVGHGVKTAVKKVGHFVKTTGAKVAKFGLKVAQSVGNVIGKAANFIPVIGKGVSRAISGVSKVAGVVSDHIHAKLGKKLEKGMKVMNKANKIMDYIPRRRDLSEEEAFQQRDISDAYYFEERDDIALEDREDSYFEAYERDIYERYDLDEE